MVDLRKIFSKLNCLGFCINNSYNRSVKQKNRNTLSQSWFTEGFENKVRKKKKTTLVKEKNHEILLFFEKFSSN